MGVVISQSFKNIVSTYLGFFIGAINTLFLYTKFLSSDYYGMVGYMLSLAYVIMPLMAFGSHNTMLKFYTTFKSKTSLNSFLTFMLLLPVVVIVPLMLLFFLSYDVVSAFLSKENDIIKGYLWHTFIIAISLVYFEVFFTWAKVQMQTVFGNFMKEVFHRVGAMILLFLLHFQIVNLSQFMAGLVIVYILRMFAMGVYAFKLRLPVIVLKRPPNLRNILKYSFLIIIAGSIATTILDLDKVMLGQYIAIKEIAYYNVAIFISAVVAVPQRAMHQILLPLSAKLLNEKDFGALEVLYKKSALNLFIVAGFIFLLIVLNINQLYCLIPIEFSAGLLVVFIISFIKLYDSALGNINAILFNSDYYRMVLILGVVLVVLMVLFNIIFIPFFGINGAGVATFLAIFLYNSIKLWFVYKKFKILPFTKITLKISIFIITMVLLFYFWDFKFHPIVNIGLKSIFIAIIYVFAVYRFSFSEDISKLIKKYLRLT